MDVKNDSASNSTVTLEVVRCIAFKFCQQYKQSPAFAGSTTLEFVIIIIFTIITPVINGVFILMAYLFEELRHTSNYFVLNIALVNITFGFGSLMSCCLYYARLIACTVDVCFYKEVFIHISGTGMALTMTTLTAISIERYICIFYALRWQQIVTNRRVAIVLGFLWVFWTGITGLLRAVDSWNIFQNIYMFQSVSNIAVLVVTNAIIFKEIRRHEKRINHEQQMAPNAEEIRRERPGKKLSFKNLTE